ncbi:MAG: SdpI family protein [Chloroflexi bacterium]|nr:SdpI family protein [Chloroflexota bacterium]
MSSLLMMFVGFSLLGMLVAVPTMLDKIKPNPFYGFRVQATLEDPKVWYAVNRYFGARLFVISLIQSIASIGLYSFARLSVDAYALSLLGIYVVTFGIAFSQTMRYMKSLK